MYEGSSSRLAVRTVVHQKGSQLEIKKRPESSVCELCHPFDHCLGEEAISPTKINVCFSDSCKS